MLCYGLRVGHLSGAPSRLTCAGLGVGEDLLQPLLELLRPLPLQLQLPLQVLQLHGTERRKRQKGMRGAEKGKT